jgi:hypothetical protein
VYPDHATFHVCIASAKIFDAFQTENGPKTTYAYTRVKVCLRRKPAPPSLAPHDWKDVALIDTEFFELPHGTTLDPEDERKTLDDMEKIHVVYLAGTKDGRCVSKSVYIGVGTGEAYGTGPSHRGVRPIFRGRENLAYYPASGMDTPGKEHSHGSTSDDGRGSVHFPDAF